MLDILVSGVIILVSGVIIAIVTAYLTVRLSLKRFRTERWWERKAETYSNILESLHLMKQYYDALIAAELNYQEISDERGKEIWGRWKGGIEEIARVTDIGSFIVSDEAVRRLEQLQGDLDLDGPDATKSFYEFLEDQFEKIQKCLSEIREIAKEDLNVK